MKAIKDGSVSYAALERKAKLYDKLVRGELSDGEEGEKYCVDFFRKGQEQEDSEQLQRHDISNTEPRDEDGDDDASLLSDTKAAGLGQAGTFDRSEHKRFVMYVLLFIHYFELKCLYAQLSRKKKSSFCVLHYLRCLQDFAVTHKTV